MSEADSNLCRLKSTLIRRQLGARSPLVKHSVRKVIVLGAGTSKSFGLPLADKLLQDKYSRTISIKSRRASLASIL